MRRLLAVLGAVVLVAALANPVDANGGNAVFAWAPTSRSIAGIVEQQSPDYFYNGGSAGGAWYCTHNADGTAKGDSCVRNPTICAWSEDDELANGAYGVLNAGSFSFSDCMIADNTVFTGPPLTHIEGRHVLGLRVVADTPDLVVTVNYQPQNVTFTFTPQLVNGRYEYRGCIAGPVPDGDQVQFIQNSNGGLGVQESITVSTVNNTGHKWQKTSADFYLWVIFPNMPNTNLCRGSANWYEQNGAMWAAAL